MNKGLAAVKKTVIRVLCIIMVSAIAVHAGSARAEIQVQTTLLEDLGSWRSFAHDINNAGQIVGYGYLVPGLRHAFSWENGALTDLGPTLAYGINNAGQMVLMSSARAYVVQGETRTDIGSLGAGVIAANAINDSGQVVGISYLPNYLAHAFRRESIYQLVQHRVKGPPGAVEEVFCQTAGEDEDILGNDAEGLPQSGERVVALGATADPDFPPGRAIESEKKVDK